MNGRPAGQGGQASRGRGPTAVEVRTPARLHLGMLSFGVPTVRSFGGIGVMIDGPGVHVRLERAEAFHARGPMAERAVACAGRCVRAWGLDAAAGCGIEVLSAPRPHVGLGSGTQLALAIAAGMRRLFVPQTAGGTGRGTATGIDGERSFAAEETVELARAVGRGQRSCVGVHGFGRGGLIVEAVRFVSTGGVAAAQPVADSSAAASSPMIARVCLPPEWRCLVIVQRDEVGLHGEQEKAAFARLPPMPVEVTAELSRIALMDLLPAAIAGSFAEFSDALYRYGSLAGRPFESESSRLAHAGPTARLIQGLGEQGVGGRAQSSWGPAVMACCESSAAAAAVAERLERDGLTRTHEVTLAAFDSRGAVLRDAD